MSLLKDESGANAVEYAVIMALVAVFIIAAKMTPDQIAEAQRMARDWQAQHEKGASEQPCRLSGPR